MSIDVENTGELRQFVENEIRRFEHDPRRPGALDTMLLSVAIGAAVVVAVGLVILTVAPDRFHVESGRIVLTLIAAGTCVAPVLLGMHGVLRHNRRRDELMLEEIRRGRCGCPSADGVDSKDLAMRSFETGRRIGRREADG